ncbi:MAG: hypothetical protein ACF8CQ_08885 [Rhodopirellula sp. JB044]|uniref:hypothetical protein n=1 Tax=Rhodopirellula sp. JB044 TaxID=3342844 RepID=UPI00370AAADF
MKSRFCGVVMLGMIALAGCDDSSQHLQIASATDGPPPSQEILAALASADKLDGQEDHVIGKCYVCQLSMDGKSELTAEAHGYTACMCSSFCRDHFTSDPDDVISNTTIPAASDDTITH